MAGNRACGWMSPDEYLLILPYDAVSAGLAVLAQHGQPMSAAELVEATGLARSTLYRQLARLKRPCLMMTRRAKPFWNCANGSKHSAWILSHGYRSFCYYRKSKAKKLKNFYNLS